MKLTDSRGLMLGTKSLVALEKYEQAAREVLS